MHNTWSDKCSDWPHFTQLALFLSIPPLFLPAPSPPKHPFINFATCHHPPTPNVLNPYALLVSPSYQSQSPDWPPQSCACNFLRARQLLPGDFWYWLLLPLSLFYQVLCLLFISYPFTYYPVCTHKIIDWITLMDQMLSPSIYHYSHNNTRGSMYILQKVRYVLLSSETIELYQR